MPGGKDIFLYGVIWDFMVTSAFIAAAFCFGKVPFAPHQYFALALMIAACFFNEDPGMRDEKARIHQQSRRSVFINATAGAKRN